MAYVRKGDERAITPEVRDYSGEYFRGKALDGRLVVVDHSTEYRNRDG